MNEPPVETTKFLNTLIRPGKVTFGNLFPHTRNHADTFKTTKEVDDLVQHIKIRQNIKI